MKVLVVTTVRFRFNGITSVILNYYRNMNKEGMQIDLVAPNEISEEYRKELESNNTRVYFLNRKGNPLSYMVGLKKILKDGKYDIVHIHGNSSMMLADVIPAVLAKTPVRIVHSHNTTCNHITLHKLLNPLFRKCYTHGLACGQEAGKWLYGDHEFVELKNGVDLTKFEYNSEVGKEYRKKLGVGDKTLIGHIGNFIEQKNHTFLIDIFADLVKKNPKYVLLLISDGVLMDQIKEKTEKLGLSDKVIFLGKTPETDKYLQAMDLMILPSLYEGLPVVLIEAQSSGLKCLVSDTVSAEANLTGTVSFIPIDSTSGWVKAIEEASEEAAVTDRKAVSEENNRKITENGYNIKESAKMLRQYYFECLKN